MRGAATGAAVFGLLYALGLTGVADPSYFGQTDAGWSAFVFSRYGGAMAAAQGWLLVLHLCIGAVLGAGAAWVRAGLRPAWGELPALRAAVIDAAAVAGVHTLVLAWGVRRRPAAYADWLWEQGGVRAFAQRLVAEWLPGWGLGLVAAAALGVVAWSLRGRPRSAAAAVQAVAVGAGWSALPDGGRRGPAPVRPHLFIVGVDSLRADRLDAGPSGPAPRLAEQAAQGEQWERAITPLARTFPSWVTLLTGTLPPRHGVRHMFPSPEALARTPPTLPGRLREEGWRTAVVGDYAADVFSRWPAGFEVRDVPGFDLPTIVSMRSLALHHHLLPWLDNGVGRALFPELRALADFTDPEAVADSALRTFDDLSAGGDPVALTVFFSGAHFPYTAARPFRGARTQGAYAGTHRYRFMPNLADDSPLAPDGVAQVRALYDESVAATDAAAGRLLDGLRARGALDNAYVVVLSDHGEELHEESAGFEHGAHLRGDSFLRTPMAIAGPGIEPGAVVPGVRSTALLAPRLAGLLGVDWDPAAVEVPGVAYAETGIWMREQGRRFYQQDRIAYPGIAALVQALPDGGFMVRPEHEAVVVAAKHRMIEDSRGRLIVRPTPDGVVEEWFPAPAGPATAPPDLRVALYARAPELRALPARLPAPLGTPTAATKLRLLDTAPTRVDVPDIDAGLRALGAYFRWIRDPWTPLAGDARRLSVLFGHKADPARDFHANRRALFLPTPAEVEWRVESGGPLRLAALAPTRLLGGPPVRVQVESGDTVLYDRVLGGRDGGPGTTDWHDVRLRHVAGRVIVRAFVAGDPAGRGGRAFIAAPVVLERRQEGRPAWNLLLVQVDALRAQDLGAGVTPVMDGLAASGTSFANMVVNHTWTRPSTVALLTGMTSDDVGLNRHSIRLPVEERRAFYAARPPLLPLAMRQAGWAADASVNNLFMLSSHGLGVDFGFQRMGDYRHLVADTPHVTESAVRFIEQSRRRRWFQFVNLNSPHMPYTPPERHLERAREAVRAAGERPEDLPGPRLRYLGELAYADEALGRILHALDSTGQADRTLVIVTADHGEIMDPAHDRLSAIRDRRSLYHHGITPFDEEVRVPLILRGPAAIPAGRVIEEQVQTLDMGRTLRELYGLPPDPRQRGMSLAGALLRGDPLPDRPIRIVGRFFRAVRTRQWKYVRHETLGPRGWSPDGAEELYDLRADPGERTDLAGAGGAALDEARRLFDAVEAEHVGGPGGAAAKVAGDGVAAAEGDDLHLDGGMDPEVLKLLREWGYL